MAKAKVVHSDDGVMIEFKGDRNNPEPTCGIIKFPGGHVEVSRCSDGSYYAHIDVVDPRNIVASRMDYATAPSLDIANIPGVPNADQIKHIAVRISNTVPHFDPN